MYLCMCTCVCVFGYVCMYVCTSGNFGNCAMKTEIANTKFLNLSVSLIHTIFSLSVSLSLSLSRTLFSLTFFLPSFLFLSFFLYSLSLSLSLFLSLSLSLSHTHTHKHADTHNRCSVSQGCRIPRLHFCRGARLSLHQRVSWIWH